MRQQRIAIVVTGILVLSIMTFYMRFWPGLLCIVPLGAMLAKELGYFPAKETPKRTTTIARPRQRTRALEKKDPAPFSNSKAPTTRVPYEKSPYEEEFALLHGTPNDAPLDFFVTRGNATFSVRNVLEMAERYIDEGIHDPETLGNLRKIYATLIDEYKKIVLSRR